MKTVEHISIPRCMTVQQEVYTFHCHSMESINLFQFTKKVSDSLCCVSSWYLWHLRSKRMKNKYFKFKGRSGHFRSSKSGFPVFDCFFFFGFIRLTWKFLTVLKLHIYSTWEWELRRFSFVYLHRIDFRHTIFSICHKVKNPIILLLLHLISWLYAIMHAVSRSSILLLLLYTGLFLCMFWPFSLPFFFSSHFVC